MSYETIRFEIRDRIATITLDRPERMNAFTWQMGAELMLSGRHFSGREAVAMGLASKALPAAEVLTAARDLARDIAVNTAPVSVAISKRLLWEGITLSVAGMMAKERRLFAYVGQQPDAAEGVMSFVQKRVPEWTLRASRDLPEWPTDDPT